jgi:hypothetical protein
MNPLSGFQYQKSPRSIQLYMGVCYAPPEGSITYLHASAVGPFGELNNAIAALHGLGGEVLIAGDLNARTCLYPDHKSYDANDQLFVMPQAHDLWHTPLNLPARANQDKKTNTSERRLLQLCHDTGLTILNGRVQGDVEGFFTSQGSSTVDFFLSSSSLFHDFSNLQVLTHSPHSDHSPVLLTMSLDRLTYECTTNLPADGYPQTHALPPTIRFNPEHIEGYRRLLTTFVADQEQLSHIDRHANDHQNVILKAATSAFGTDGCRRHTSFLSNPWYDVECKTMRKRLQSVIQVGDPEVLKISER